MGKNPTRRLRRRHYEPPSPVSQVLRLVEQRLSQAQYKAKTVGDFRKSLRALTADDKFWKQLESLRVSVEGLKASLDDLGV